MEIRETPPSTLGTLLSSETSAGREKSFEVLERGYRALTETGGDKKEIDAAVKAQEKTLERRGWDRKYVARMLGLPENTPVNARWVAIVKGIQVIVDIPEKDRDGVVGPQTVVAVRDYKGKGLNPFASLIAGQLIPAKKSRPARPGQDGTTV